jgi:dTDP-glucose pyrophosphorylase
MQNQISGIGQSIQLKEQFIKNTTFGLMMAIQL